MISKRTIAILCATLLMAGCGYNRFDPIEVEWQEGVASTDISALVALGDVGTPLPSGSTIVGRVTANDEGGNFYRLLMIEDSTGAVGLRLAFSGLGGNYPVGAEVEVDVGGLTLGRYNGSPELGRASHIWDYYTTEPITDPVEMAGRIRVCGPREEIVPPTLSPESLSEDMCGRLVRIEGLRHHPDESGEISYWGVTPYGSEAELPLTTTEGHTIVVITSTYADFASEPVPSAEMALGGILYRIRHGGEAVWALKMRTISDVETVVP